MAATISPVARVLSTTELLEAILENFLLTSLLHSQQVCKRWQAVIQESNTLQRKLYLKADASERVVLREGNSKAQVGQQWAEWHWASESDKTKAVTKTISWNPCMDSFFKCHGWVGYSHYFGVIPTILTSPDTWRVMYVSSPPVACLELDLNMNYENHRGGLDSDRYRQLKVKMTDGVGVRLGDIFDVVRAKVTDRGLYSAYMSLTPCLKDRPYHWGCLVGGR